MAKIIQFPEPKPSTITRAEYVAKIKDIESFNKFVSDYYFPEFQKDYYKKALHIFLGTLYKEVIADFEIVRRNLGVDKWIMSVDTDNMSVYFEEIVYSEGS